MIARNNYQIVKSYIANLRQSGKLDDRTVNNIHGHLIHMLYWAGPTPFTEVHKLERRFPRYLMEAQRRDGKQKPLSYNYVAHAAISAKKFFIHLGERSTKFRKVSSSTFLGEFDLTRADRKQLPSPKIPFFVSLELAVLLATSPAETLKEIRTRAMACWLFISGQRIGSALTTSLEAIDIERLKVHQLSALGVKTKNGKQGITDLLPKCEQLLPLYTIVEDWIKFLRSQPHIPKYFFARIDESGEALSNDNTTPVDLDGSNFRRDLADWCKKLGLEPINPHAFRHGYAHFALALGNGFEGANVVSQNMLHSDVTVTLKIYFRFLADNNGNLLAQMYDRQRGRGKNLSANISDPQLNYLEKYGSLSANRRHMIDQLIDSLLKEDEE